MALARILVYLGSLIMKTRRQIILPVLTFPYACHLTPCCTIGVQLADYYESLPVASVLVPKVHFLQYPRLSFFFILKMKVGIGMPGWHS